MNDDWCGSDRLAPDLSKETTWGGSGTDQHWLHNARCGTIEQIVLPDGL